MHDGNTASWDSTAKALDRADFERNYLEPLTKQYILSQTNITDELYEEQYRKEWYMLPDEAKKYGICTHIVGTDCTLDDII
jgi:ATP-dependent protease ClpP protease subunit